MATNETTTTTGEAITLSEDRRFLALQANWEVEALCEAAVRELPADVSYLHLRGMVLRIKQLACLTISALDDELEDLARLNFQLTGIRPTAAAEVDHV